MSEIKKILQSFFILSLMVITFLSCEGNASDEGDDIVTYITINTNSNTQFVGQVFEFTVINNLNEDITQQSEIYIDGNLIEGNSISFSEAGTHEVYAISNEFESNIIQVEAIIGEGVNFKQRILYEDYTGTWCGYCPIAFVRYEHLVEQNPNVVFVGVHGPSNTSDPYTNATASALDDYTEVSGRPAMYINRKIEWPYSFDYTDLSIPINQIQAFSKIGIEVNSSLNNMQINATVNIAFANNYTNLRLVNYIVEDNLYYPQRNYFNGSGGSPVFYDGLYEIEDYYHKNVLRDTSSGILGVEIPNNSSTEGNVFSNSFTYNIPSDFVADNIKIVSFIINSEGKVLNVREVEMNTNNPYEVL